ncbi:MAG: hypothetical protein IJT51_04670 [Bacteroidales bacterium]|nr:hypothetical protein [Bacteroidales bacterium]
MKIRKFLILLILLLSTTIAIGQNVKDIWLKYHLYINEVELLIDTYGKDIPTIVIDSNGDKMFANVIVNFEVMDYDDISQEVLLTNFIVSSIVLFDYPHSKMKIEDIIYPERYCLPLPVGIDSITRNKLFTYIETTFNEEQKQWRITVPTNYSRKDIEGFPIWEKRGSLSCWIVCKLPE